MAKYFRDAAGNYIGGYEGVDPPEGAIEVPFAPSNASDIWADDAWTPSLQAQIADIDAQLKAIDDQLYRTRGTREMDLQVSVYFAQLQGFTEPQLYAASNEYRRVKDAELITAKALRNQRKILDDQLDALS